MRLATHLNVQAARLEHSGDVPTTARTLKTLDALLGDHVEKERAIVYPKLLESERADDVAVARETLGKLDSLKGVWRQYADFWSEAQIESQPSAFAATSRFMLDAVMAHVRHENDELYPRLA